MAAVNAHAFRDGELCVPIHGLAFHATALRALLGAHTRPHEASYVAQVAAGSRAPS